MSKNFELVARLQNFPSNYWGTTTSTVITVKSLEGCHMCLIFKHVDIVYSLKDLILDNTGLGYLYSEIDYEDWWLEMILDSGLSI